MFWNTYIATCWKCKREYKFKGFGNKNRYHQFMNENHNKCPVCNLRFLSAPLPSYKIQCPNKAETKTNKFSGMYYFKIGEYVQYLQITEDIINQIKNIMREQDVNCWDKIIRKFMNEIYEVQYPNDIIDGISFGCNEKDNSKYINIKIKSCYSCLFYPHHIKPIMPNNKVKLHKVYMVKKKR